MRSPVGAVQRAQRQSKVKADPSEVARLESELTGLKERESRLVHLYTMGEVREEALRDESAGIASQRMVLEEQLGSLRRQALPFLEDVDPERLNSICAAVAEWLELAGEPEKDLVLEALQIGVTATVDETRVSGVLPTELPSFLANESEQECSDFMVTSGIPFGRASHSG